MRYPWLTEITYDQGKEYIGQEFRKMIEEDYGIKTQPATVHNPQANSVLEQIHQVLSDRIQVYELEKYYLDKNTHGLEYYPLQLSHLALHIIWHLKLHQGNWYLAGT